MSASFATPYAHPQGQGPAAPLQGALGPYVPKAVRVAPPRVEASASAEWLPWIDAFLAATPAHGAPAIAATEEALLGAAVSVEGVPVSAAEPPTTTPETTPDTLRWFRYDADTQVPLAVVPERVVEDPPMPLLPAPPSVTRGGDSESAEAAAMALELLALRVRAGELPLSGYDPSMGDAAALVAALAALLGVRLGD